MFNLLEQQKLEKFFSQISCDPKTKSFLNTSNFEKMLQEHGFMIIYNTIDLIYFDDIDRPYQDSSGVEYTLKIESKKLKQYFFNVRYFNWSSLGCERRIYCEKAKEFEDYSTENEIYELSFIDFFNENIS